MTLFRRHFWAGWSGLSVLGEDLSLENLPSVSNCSLCTPTDLAVDSVAPHKLFWVALRSFWSEWTKPLVLALPEPS